MMNAKKALMGLYPSTKFLSALVFGIGALISPTYWFGFIGFILTFVVACIIGEGVRYTKTVRNSLLVLGIFMLIMRSLFTPGGEVIFSFWIFKVTKEGLNAGLSMVSVVFSLGGSLLLFFIMTPIKDITTALENFGMSPTATYVVLSAIQMIPEMKKQASVIMDAQKTRGVETEGSIKVRMKAFIPTLGPLILSTFANTEERVITLESRAFTAPVKKTSLYQLQKTILDKILLCILVLLFIGIIVWRIIV